MIIIFFSNIFGNILKGKTGFVGKHEDFKKNPNIICLSTKKAAFDNDNHYIESFISTFQVLVNSEDRIKRIIIEYDNLNQYKLYPEENNKKNY